MATKVIVATYEALKLLFKLLRCMTEFCGSPEVLASLLLDITALERLFHVLECNLLQWCCLQCVLVDLLRFSLGGPVG
eukprot:1581216-Amphidinium_carterae.1